MALLLKVCHSYKLMKHFTLDICSQDDTLDVDMDAAVLHSVEENYGTIEYIIKAVLSIKLFWKQCVGLYQCAGSMVSLKKLAS